MQKKNKSPKKSTKKAVVVKLHKKITKKAVKHKTISSRKARPSAILDLKDLKKIETKTIAATERFLTKAKKEVDSKVSFKQFVYIALSVVVGLLLGTVLHLAAELVYVKNAVSHGEMLKTNYCLGIESYLPISIGAIFLLVGLIFGIWLGIWGWRVVYVEGRRHKWF